MDLQCGACGTLCHRGVDPPPRGPKAPPEGGERGGPPGALKFCPCCGAGYDRYCIRCQRRVEMYFEEWWPEEDVCVRTYSPAKRCPTCNAGLEGGDREEARADSVYEH